MSSAGQKSTYGVIHPLNNCGQNFNNRGSQVSSQRKKPLPFGSGLLRLERTLEYWRTEGTVFLSTGLLFFLTIGPIKMQISAFGVITKLTTADDINSLNKNYGKTLRDKSNGRVRVLYASDTLPDLRELLRPLRHLCAHPTQLYET